MRWVLFLMLFMLFNSVTFAENYSNNKIADAIYKAEGGSRASHAYGILAHYKHTTPRQACLNTIANARCKYEKSDKYIDFISFLGKIYCPIGASNDPMGLNKNWVKNVRYFLREG